MKTSRIANVLALAGAGFITYIGVRYLADPQGMAPGMGFKAYPTGQAADFLNVKGVRDVVSGLAVVALLAARERRALGILLLVESVIPVGDMLSVLRHDGSTATAFGVHGLTAALVAATGLLVLGERRTAAAESPAVTSVAVG
ncbi:DUF4267 domain-containing protein [Nocardia sp. NPDC088792]|uniref:DUF4267 domain-containing protein n=1 Tax=Nocardia sp. NPDC088792 TaxID=3364332 RepID=UPI0038022B4E